MADVETDNLHETPSENIPASDPQNTASSEASPAPDATAPGQQENQPIAESVPPTETTDAAAETPAAEAQENIDLQDVAELSEPLALEDQAASFSSETIIVQELISFDGSIEPPAAEAQEARPPAEPGPTEVSETTGSTEHPETFVEPPSVQAQAEHEPAPSEPAETSTEAPGEPPALEAQTEAPETIVVPEPATDTRETASAVETEPPPTESAITGQIRNAPPGAQVILAGAGETHTSSIGPDGVYGFTNLAAGSYVLALSGVGIITASIVLDGRQALVVDYAVPARPASKIFAHYLLFGPGHLPSTLTNLILAIDYITRFTPLTGFSVEEARHARRVTIVGDTTAVGAAVEQGLRDAGCVVVRLTAPDSYALENLFKELVASGTPYPR